MSGLSTGPLTNSENDDLVARDAAPRSSTKSPTATPSDLFGPCPSTLNEPYGRFDNGNRECSGIGTQESLLRICVSPRSQPSSRPT